jgi:hypothetical protein
MTLPKDSGGKSGGKGKKIAAGVGGVVAVLVALAAVGAANQPSTVDRDAPLLGENSPTAGVNLLVVDLSFARNPLSRGSTQTIFVSTHDDNGAVSGAAVTGRIVYASGSERTFGGATDGTGRFIYTWQIGGNSNPGTFLVDVNVSSNGQNIEKYSSFNVTPAS